MPQMTCMPQPSRVTADPELTFDDLLGEMVAYGVADLAEEAAALLERQGTTQAGENARLAVRDTIWVAGQPGQGSVEVDGKSWRSWDYIRRRCTCPRSWRESFSYRSRLWRSVSA